MVGLTCIKYKCHALAWVEEDDCGCIPAVVPLELDGRTVVRVVGEVEEDLILGCAGHGRWSSSGIKGSEEQQGRRVGASGR